jgi:hypothetical protein
MRDSLQTGALHPFLEIDHVLIGERLRLAHIAQQGFADRVQKGRRAQHFVIAECIAYRGIIAQGN